MSSGGSVTHWIRELKEGEESALLKLHERYWPFLVAMARKKLGGSATRRAADEEDVAQVAFMAFYKNLKEGRFPNLVNRNDLLSLLVLITVRKALTQLQNDRRAKRGRGRVRGESALDFLTSSGDLTGGINQVKGRGRSPQEEAMMNDIYQQYVHGLPDNLQEFAELYLAGLTQEEMAGSLGCSLRTVERKVPLFLKKWQEMAAQEMEV